MTEPLLDVKGLRVSIGTADGLLRPVRGVSFNVARGETLAIVGESGCGKSLTSLALMGLLPVGAKVAADHVTLGGRSLMGLSGGTAWRGIRGAQMAMIFQDPMTALDPCYRIGDQMTEVLRQHRPLSRVAALSRAAELLEKVGISLPGQRLRQYPHELSGGLRQRVMIAMALLCEPQLIIADEPTTALDVTIQAQVLRLLRRIQEDTGVGLILITHDLGVVAAVADRVAVMYGGEIVESGPCEAVLARPLHPYTEGLLRALPVPGETTRGGTLGFIPGVVPRPDAELTQCGFIGRCPYACDACRTPIPLHEASGHRAVRCVLPDDGGGRAADAWARTAGAA